MSNEIYEAAIGLLTVFGAVQTVRHYFAKNDSKTYGNELNRVNLKDRQNSSKLDFQNTELGKLHKKLQKSTQDLNAANSYIEQLRGELTEVYLNQRIVKRKLKAFEETEMLMKASPTVLYTEKIPLMGVQLELSDYEAKTYSKAKINELISNMIADSLSRFLTPLIYVNRRDNKTKVEAKFYFKQLES